MTKFILPSQVQKEIDDKDLEGVDLNTTVDKGERDDELNKWFLRAFAQFGFFMYTSMPDKFKEPDERKTAIKSTEKGLNAFKRAKFIMKKLKKGDKFKLENRARNAIDDGVEQSVNTNGLMPEENYESHELGNWYLENIIEYIRMALDQGLIPDKFLIEGEDVEQFYMSECISGLDQVIIKLKEELSEIS